MRLICFNSGTSSPQFSGERCSFGLPSVSPATPRESLKRCEIIRRRRDLKTLLLRGRKITGTALALYYHKQNETGLQPRRVAILLDRKIKGAVVRNRLKRHLREIFRRNKGWFPLGFDYAIQARSAAVELEFEQLKGELKALAERIES